MGVFERTWLTWFFHEKQSAYMAFWLVICLCSYMTSCTSIWLDHFLAVWITFWLKMGMNIWLVASIWLEVDMFVCPHVYLTGYMTIWQFTWFFMRNSTFVWLYGWLLDSLAKKRCVCMSTYYLAIWMTFWREIVCSYDCITDCVWLYATTWVYGWLHDCVAD